MGKAFIKALERTIAWADNCDTAQECLEKLLQFFKVEVEIEQQSNHNTKHEQQHQSKVQTP